MSSREQYIEWKGYKLMVNHYTVLTHPPKSCMYPAHPIYKKEKVAKKQPILRS